MKKANNRFERDAGLAVILFHSYVSGPRPSSAALGQNKNEGRIQMKKLIAAMIIVSVGALAQAQEPADTTTKPLPSTKLEAFSARTGIVMIKAFSIIGTVNGLGAVTVDAREFRDASNPKQREYGLAIAVKESGRLERESTSFIDADEIDPLIRGIDYIEKIDENVTTMNDFEASYKTKGDLSITTFSSTERSGEISVAVSSGRIGKRTAYLKLSDMNQIKYLIAEAKKKIDSARAATK